MPGESYSIAANVLFLDCASYEEVDQRAVRGVGGHRDYHHSLAFRHSGRVNDYLVASALARGYILDRFNLDCIPVGIHLIDLEVALAVVLAFELRIHSAALPNGSEIEGIGLEYGLRRLGPLLGGPVGKVFLGEGPDVYRLRH